MSQRTKTLKAYRALEPSAFLKEEGELREAIWKMKVQQGTGQATDALKVGESKRNLARLLTLRREREVSVTPAKRSKRGK